MTNAQRNNNVKRNVFCFYYMYKLSFTGGYVCDRGRSQIYIFPYSICFWSLKSSRDWIFSGKVESKIELLLHPQSWKKNRPFEEYLFKIIFFFYSFPRFSVLIKVHTCLFKINILPFLKLLCYLISFNFFFH